MEPTTTVFKVYVMICEADKYIKTISVEVDENETPNGKLICNKIIHLQDAEANVKKYMRLITEGVFKVLSNYDMKKLSLGSAVITGNLFDSDDRLLYTPSNKLDAFIISRSGKPCDFNWNTVGYVTSFICIRKRLLSGRPLQDVIAAKFDLYDCDFKTKSIKSVYNSYMTSSYDNSFRYLLVWKNETD